MAPLNSKVDSRKKCSEKIIHHLVNAARKLKRRKVKLNSVIKRKLKLTSSSETQAQLIAESLVPASTTSTESPSLQDQQQAYGSRADLLSSVKSPSLISYPCHQTVTPLRARSPSLSPVVVPSCLSGNDVSTPPGQMPHHRLSPGWHQSFSISAILSRASSTPKKEDSISLQSSVCSSFMTSSESGSTNMSPEFLEQNKENRASCLHDVDISCSTDHRASTSGHCDSCQHNNTSRRKMERTKFSKEDIQILNDYFWKDRYPSATEIEQLARQLGYRVVQIKTWFQNKRASVSGTRQPKTQNPSQLVTYSPPSMTGHHQAMFLPVTKSLMDNVQYHPSMLTRSHPAPSVNVMAHFPAYSSTIDTRFAPGASSHFVPAAHNARILPPSIVTHFPPISPFHYFGNGYL